jgi:hypothetical protein
MGYPLKYGGYRFARPSDNDHRLAALVRNSGKSFNIANTKELDLQWRMAAGWS